MTQQYSSTALVLPAQKSQTNLTGTGIDFSSASTLVSNSIDDIRQVLKRQDSNSYGKKEHKKANKSIQDVLKYYNSLLRILKQQQEDEAYIDEATIEVAKIRRKQVQELIETFQQQPNETKWYNRLRNPDRKKGFHGIDLEHLQLLSEGLETLIENLVSARKKKLSVQQDIVRLVENQDFSRLQLREAQTQISLKESNLAKETFRQIRIPFLPYWKRHEQCSRERLPKTCTWILETEAYRRWRGVSGDWQSQRQLLWLHGSVGTGKSILASYVVDIRREQSKYVAYYYFGNGLVQTIPEVVVSLLTQLWTAAESDPDIDMNSLQNTTIEKFDQGSKVCFKSFIMHVTPKPTIVLDGWDEERMHDLRRFERFLSVLLGLGYFVLLTSRSKPTFLTHSDQFQSFYNLSLPSVIQRADLFTFSEHVILSNQNAPAYGVVNKSKDKIIKSIIDGKGINSFHTLRLYLESALKQTSEAEVEAILTETDPVRLIFRDDAEYPARHISEASLLWLSQTKRPMKIDALREALALLESASLRNDEDHATLVQNKTSMIWRAFPEANQLPTTAFVQNCGMNLLRVDEASDTIALSHSLAMPPLPHIQTVSVLADMCISVLSINELSTFEYHDWNVVRDYTSKHQFLCHAACTFELHIENDEMSEDMRPTLVQVLDDHSRLWKILAIREWCKQNHNELAASVWQNAIKSIEQTTAVQVAIECGDWKTLNELLDLSQQRSDQETGGDRSAPTQSELESWCLLSFDNEQQRSKCFDILYEKLLDLTSLDKPPQLPVIEKPNYNLGLVPSHHSNTTNERWIKVYEWFDKRHDITGYQTNLEKLSHSVRARDLLALRSARSRASDQNLRSSITACVLQAAILNNDIEMFEKLLQSGFRPSQHSTSIGRRGHSPLHAAARVGSVVMLSMLMEQGADVNVLNVEGQTALFPAIDFAHEHNASPGSVSLVKMLLISGVDVNAPCKKMDVGTALDYAIAKGSVAIVELLLQHGAKSLQTRSTTSSVSIINLEGTPPPLSHSDSVLSRTTTNESYSSSSEEIRDMLEKRQRSLARLQRSRLKRLSLNKEH